MTHGHEAGLKNVVEGWSVLLSNLLPSEWNSMCAVARVKEFNRGSMLYLEGDSAQQVLLLISGVAKITKVGADGTEVIVRLAGIGDVLGASVLFSTGQHGTTAQAFRQCRAFVWEADAFKTLVRRFPILLQNILRIVCAEGRELEAKFQEVATERVMVRVARQLLRLQEKIGRSVNGGTTQVDVSREELAHMTGTTLFTVSRLLSAWGAQGFVRPGREAVVVCRPDVLLAISEGAASLSVSQVMPTFPAM